MIITFYCACALCCAHNAGGPTASGKMPSAGRTAASASLPLGARVKIEGIGTRVIEDRMKAAGGIDVFVSTHAEAVRLGMQRRNVTVKSLPISRVRVSTAHAARTEVKPRGALGLPIAGTRAP